MTMSSRLPWRHVGVRVARIVGGAEQSPGQQRAARPSGTNLIGRAGSQATPPGVSQQQRPSRPERTAAGAIAVASAITRPIRSTQLGRLGCDDEDEDDGKPHVSSAQSQDAQSVWAQLPRTAQGDSYFSLHALPPNATVPRPSDWRARERLEGGRLARGQVADMADTFQGEPRRSARDPGVTSRLAQLKAARAGTIDGQTLSYHTRHGKKRTQNG